MPIIKVWCLPLLEENRYQKLHKAIVMAVCNVTELGLKDENDMTVLFPSDLMSYGLGEEIIIEITGLFRKPERTKEVRDCLAESLGSVIKVLFPKSKVECFVFPFDQEKGSFWTNEV